MSLEMSCGGVVVSERGYGDAGVVGVQFQRGHNGAFGYRGSEVCCLLIT